MIDKDLVQVASPLKFDVAECIQPMIDSHMVDWIRLEINIYFSRIMCLILFAFYEVTFTK